MQPLLSLFGICLLLVVTLTDTAVAQKVRGVVLEQPKTLPTFALVDQYGEAFGVNRLKGHWSMIFIGFTSCPDVCPFTLANLEAVRSELGLRLPPAHIPQIVFLAVDPARDQPILKDYLAHFHPDYVGITGEPQQITKLVDGLDGFFRLEKTGPNDHTYNVKHSAAVSIINPEAKLVARISPPFHPHRTADYLLKVIKGVKATTVSLDPTGQSPVEAMKDSIHDHHQHQHQQN